MRRLMGTPVMVVALLGSTSAAVAAVPQPVYFWESTVATIAGPGQPSLPPVIRPKAIMLFADGSWDVEQLRWSGDSWYFATKPSTPRRPVTNTIDFLARSIGGGCSMSTLQVKCETYGKPGQVTTLKRGGAVTTCVLQSGGANNCGQGDFGERTPHYAVGKKVTVGRFRCQVLTTGVTVIGTTAPGLAPERDVAWRIFPYGAAQSAGGPRRRLGGSAAAHGHAAADGHGDEAHGAGGADRGRSPLEPGRGIGGRGGGRHAGRRHHRVGGGHGVGGSEVLRRRRRRVDGVGRAQVAGRRAGGRCEHPAAEDDSHGGDETGTGEQHDKRLL
jgi:hypothetical protein